MVGLAPAQIYSWFVITTTLDLWETGGLGQWSGE